MLSKENEILITVPGGGSGPISIEDALLNYTPNVWGIVGNTDFGGHTKLIRTSLGVCPTGDATHRLAVRIRDPEVRELFTYRHGENGQRGSNDFLATSIKATGSFSLGIKRFEKAFSAWYTGRLTPSSDDERVHIKVELADGRILVGEDKLDNLKSSKPPIIEMEFVREVEGSKPEDWPHYDPRPFAESILALRESDGILIPPGSWHGSIRAVLEVSEFYEAIRRSQALIFWVCNACDYLDWPPAQYLQELRFKIGRKVDYALINIPNHQLPQSYTNENKKFVIFDDKSLKECGNYAVEIEPIHMTEVLDIDGKPTIRHNGEIVASYIMAKLYNRRLLNHLKLQSFFQT